MKDDWVASALFDDTVVAELLSRLKQAPSQPPKPPPLLSLPLGWGLRQPRSKPKKDRPTITTTTTTRCSPTTPLSWSGGATASPSDGGYDYDYYSNSNSNSNSSRPSSDPSRSKGAFTNEPSICSNSKRSKKKTFAELKEEESLLLKERVTLKRELASLHVTLEEQKARSENLKRIKIDLNLQPSGELLGTSGGIDIAVANQCNQMEASASHHPHAALLSHAVQDGFRSSDSCRVENEVDMQKSCFVLPDLNMMPSDEEIGPEILNGFS